MERFDLDATSFEIRSEAAPSDTYTIRVIVDDTNSDTATILMGACRDLDQRVEVRVGQDGRVNGIVFPDNICGD
jgi:multidrug efflux pump subunit AcrA (membrane-fusion protein)